MEGYRSPPPSSTTQHPVKQSTPSANEVLRQVFPPTTPGAGGYIPLPSPSKRRQKAESNEDASVDKQSTDLDEIMQDIDGEKMDVERPIKPLRRSAVRSTKVESSQWTPHRISMSPELTDINSTQELGSVASGSTAHTEDGFLDLHSNTAPQ